MEVKSESREIFARKEAALFFQSVQTQTGQGVKKLCEESHVSSRTYYRILRQKEVRIDCYFRLFVGLCHIASYEEVMEGWNELGKSLYMKFSEE